MSTHQPCPCPCPRPGVTGAPALEALPPEPTTPHRRAGEQGTTKTRSRSYRSARKANFSLQPCSSVGALEREERGQGRSEPWEQPLPPPRGTRRRRMVALTYRRAHRSPQPGLPLWTADGELALHQGHCMRLAPVLPTHLFSLHVCSNDGPVRADDDAGLSLLSLQEAQLGVDAPAPMPGLRKGGGMQSVTFSPGEPCKPGEPWSPFGPTGPCTEKQGTSASSSSPKTRGRIGNQSLGTRSISPWRGGPASRLPAISPSQRPQACTNFGSWLLSSLRVPLRHSLIPSICPIPRGVSWAFPSSPLDACPQPQLAPGGCPAAGSGVPPTHREAGVPRSALRGDGYR